MQVALAIKNLANGPVILEGLCSCIFAWRNMSATLGWCFCLKKHVCYFGMVLQWYTATILRPLTENWEIYFQWTAATNILFLLIFYNRKKLLCYIDLISHTKTTAGQITAKPTMGNFTSTAGRRGFARLVQFRPAMGVYCYDSSKLCYCTSSVYGWIYSSTIMLIMVFVALLWKKISTYRNH